MDQTSCRLCGAAREEHFRVAVVDKGLMEVCPTAMYTPVGTTKAVLELDKMPVYDGVIPGSPAAEGKVWSPGKNRWVDPNQEPV